MSVNMRSTRLFWSRTLSASAASTASMTSNPRSRSVSVVNNLHGVVVFDHEDRFPAAHVRRCRVSTCACRRDLPLLPSDLRQVDFHGRAVSGKAVELDVPLGLFDESEHLAEPETGALSQRLRGEERIERTFAALPPTCRLPVSVMHKTM